ERGGRASRTIGAASRSGQRFAFGGGAVSDRVDEALVFWVSSGMIEPPRQEAKEAVARAKGAGIRPMMITGDHPKTAAVIAEELGIVENGRAVTGAEIEKASEDALARIVNEVSVYARVNPEHKLRIVKALQHEGAT